MAGRLCGRFDLQQRDPRMIQKHSARRRELHSAGSSNEKVCAQFLFETANLAAQRRLCDEKSLFGCHREAALLGHGNEIT